MIATTPKLRGLLRDCKVQASFADVTGRRRRAPVVVQLALLRSLGVEVGYPEEADEVLRRRKLERALRGIEPVMVAWNGRRSVFNLTLPAESRGEEVCYEVDVGREVIRRQYRRDKLHAAGEPDEDFGGFTTYRVPLPSRLPHGYHSLRVYGNDLCFESLIISTPRKAYVHQEPAPPTEPAKGRLAAQQRREWGTFIPLYSLRKHNDWGAGDFGSLRKLADWTAEQGGSVVGTLPLFAAFLGEPFEPSPYRPASRLFWNEFYIDVEALPELRESESARALANSDEFHRQLGSARTKEFVDYHEAWARKQCVLATLAHYFVSQRPPRYSQFQEFIAQNRSVEDYARFRAAVDRRRAGWQTWPDRMRDGDLKEGDYDQSRAEFYLYSQWIAEQQVDSLAKQAERDNCGLYLDLPVGVDPASYDVWRHQSQYLTDTTMGAPPDPVFTKGQDWGLPPLHPERIREDGYRLFRRVLEANMKFARYLRIDHVMGLERVYCVPPGFSPDRGVYLRYNTEEMFAIVVLESHRHQCAVLGENLGTVPREIDRRMTRHGIGGMWVAPYELEPGRRDVLTEPPPGSVASLNTHDMPPFASWRRAGEVEDRQALGLIDEEAARRERDQRREQLKKLEHWLQAVGAIDDDKPKDEDQVDRGLLTALLTTIAGSPAALVLINLEDLWLESRFQNFPGTSNERPNWTRRAQLSFEEFCNKPEVLGILQQVASARRGKPKPR